MTQNASLLKKKCTSWQKKEITLRRKPQNCLYSQELIKLPEDLEKIFQDDVKLIAKQNNMAYITDSSRRLADSMTKGAFGESYLELREHLVVAIVKLYSQSKFNIEMIADTLQLEKKYVRKVLKSKNLL